MDRVAPEQRNAWRFPWLFIIGKLRKAGNYGR